MTDRGPAAPPKTAPQAAPKTAPKPAMQPAMQPGKRSSPPRLSTQTGAKSGRADPPTDSGTEERPKAVDMSTIDRFEIDAEIGRGGMAVVYAARDRDSGARVALKMLTGAVDDVARARFNREVKAASQLHHPGICGVVAWGEDRGQAFMAMEFVDGETLSKLAKRSPIVPAAIAAEVLRQLLEALSVAHAAGVVHRDLKPANVMVTPEGRLKLLDFGIAKGVDDETVTQTGALIGTPSFMSPEQVRTEPLDGRSDLFSAALTVEALCKKNQHRFAGRNLDATQMLLRVAFEPMPPLFEDVPHVPTALDSVLARLTALVVDQRFADAQTALQALRATGLLLPDGQAVLARFLNDPDSVGRTLALEQARAEIAFADVVEPRTGGEVAAALALHRAYVLDPSNPRVNDRLSALCTKHNLTFSDATDDKIVAMRDDVKKQPEAPAPLKRLSDLYKGRGNVRLAAAYLWRYVTVRPDDQHAIHQLSIMLDGPTDAPTGQRQRLSTKSIVAGIATGGVKAGGASRAGVPTRALERPGGVRLLRPDQQQQAQPQTPQAISGQPLQVVVAPTADKEGTSALGKLVVVAVLLVAFSFAVFLLANSVSLFDKTQPDSKRIDAEEKIAVERMRIDRLQKAKAALGSGDLAQARLLASEALVDPDRTVEAAQSARWILAQVALRTRDHADAEKYLREYLDKVTLDSDPNIVEAKRLLEQLRTGTLPLGGGALQ